MGDIEKKKDRRLRGYRPGPFAAIYAGLLAAGLAAAAAVYYVLVHDVPGMAKDRADTVKTALLVIGGSGALAGLYVSYRKQRADEANHLRDQDKLFTERYTAAVAQLGSPAAAVRLGGVYALARIADDSERDRPTCLEVLCAYLRMPYDSHSAEPAERQVRITAQAAIARRLDPNHPGFWPEAQIDLAGAHLMDLDFSRIIVSTIRADRATFSGSTRFGWSVFSDGCVFNEATFMGQTTFHEAVFSGVSSFGAAKFGGPVGFDEAVFNGRAAFGYIMFHERASFEGVTFAGQAGFWETTFMNRSGFSPGSRIGR